MLALLVGFGLPAAHATAQTTPFSPHAVGAPTTAVTFNGVQLVFWKGANNHLWEAWFKPGPQSVNGNGWNGPVDVSANFLGGAVLVSAPSVAVTSTPVTPNGAQVVFWEGASGHLFEAWWEDNHGWNGPVDWTTSAFGSTTLGGGAAPPLTSSPSVAATPDGTQIVFFRSGAANGLYEAWYNGHWNGPVNLDGGLANLASAPSATVMPNGTQVVCWQGQNGHLEEIQGNSSQGFGAISDITTTAFGGKALLTSAPGVASTPDNKQIVFWRATGGDLNEAWLSGSTWNGPVDLTAAYFHGMARPNSAPAAAVISDGTQIVFWQSASSTLDEAWFNGSWQGPAQY